MNIKLLRRIQKKILAEPRQFQMARLFAETIYRKSGKKSPSIPNCGTAACIAGWAVCFGKRKNPRACENGGAWLGDSVYAREMIELTESQKERLFFSHNWPLKFQKIEDAGTVAFARQAAKRIDFFIKTNGTDVE